MFLGNCVGNTPAIASISFPGLCLEGINIDCCDSQIKITPFLQTVLSESAMPILCQRFLR